MPESFRYVEINDIPFKIEATTISPVSRLIPSDDGREIVERALTDSELTWYLDRAEDNACLIDEDTAFRLASELS